MKKLFILLFLLQTALVCYSQTTPAITAWLLNTTKMGKYYVKGNSTAIGNNILANCQDVQYSNDWVYVFTKGIPMYPTGPFLDGNPSQAQNQNGIFRIPLKPTQNTGTPTATTGGNIGIFINGVALFDYRDGVSWRNATNSLCGGPIQPPCMGDNVWNRDAVVAEKSGFDCAKGHPAMGNYHHHQNPSAFKLDKNVISTVCNLYDADGLYVIEPTKHSPLIGFAYDGFPIYGSYGYKNSDGTGGIVRIKSSYALRAISARNTYSNGSSVTPGPPVSSTYPLGYFREDYEFISHSGEDDYLDEHNGRFCKTPEYPNGTYAYFATVDENHNSAYPYIVGPTFYGNKVVTKVNGINEPTKKYVPPATSVNNEIKNIKISINPNPSSDLIAMQIDGILKTDIDVQLVDIKGKLVNKTKILSGSTIAFFNTEALYQGSYFVKFVGENFNITKKVIIKKD